jgi:hypothetical protein
VIIPVTGIDLAAPRLGLNGISQPWLNLGIGLLGLAFVLYGLGSRAGRK